MLEQTDTKETLIQNFRSYREIAEKAMLQVNDDLFFAAPQQGHNSIAIIVKHLSGNLRSRWTDFETSDGEKPDRFRESEFTIESRDSRASLMKQWAASFSIVEESLSKLSSERLEKTVVVIRGEKLSAIAAAIRSLTHLAYHIGQIVYLARLLFAGSEWKWISIAPGGSEAFNREMGYAVSANQPPKPGER